MGRKQVWIDIKCLSCDVVFRAKPHKKRRFCGLSCASRFNYTDNKLKGCFKHGHIGKPAWNRKYKDRKECKRISALKRYNTVKGKLHCLISSYIWESLKGKKNHNNLAKLVGYTMEELKVHLEKQFKPGMNWENHNKFGWHIDHEIPISVFNFDSPKDIDFKRCWDLSNLQPMWAKENLSKQAKIEKMFQPSLNIKEK